MATKNQTMTAKELCNALRIRWQEYKCAKTRVEKARALRRLQKAQERLGLPRTVA